MDDKNQSYSDQVSNQIRKQLEQEIETEEWKLNATKNNIFTSPGLRKASGVKLIANESDASVGNDQQKAPLAPTQGGFSAKGLVHGKRMRLK